ncbi:hypothetical protein L226DRAFT_534655 [Lentinus tigrinus ALCF2SS1-7]|nr:hypothetical protein L226DRAFT_534655 [Lentinus tigrinus ALCF2SS1-7]
MSTEQHATYTRRASVAASGDGLIYARPRRLSRLQLNQPLKYPSLSSLNGDVLHEIVSYLRGRDALSLSLTTRRVHDFAIHRVASRLVCRTAFDLRRIHKYLLEGQPKPAVFLRSLSIMGSTFIDRPWQDDPNWAFPETTYEYSLAPLVGDILEASQGLTHLLLEHYAPLARHDSRVGPAVASMSRLGTLELCQVDPDSLTVFQTLRSRPRHLRVSTVHTAGQSEARQVLDFMHDALAAVSSIKQLHVLDLDVSAINCRPFTVPLEPRPDPIPLPYVHSLSIHWLTQLVDVAALFPNLTVFEQHINSFQLERPIGKPLRRLSATELRMQDSPTQQVHMLHLRRYPRDLQSFLRTIGATSPVGLSLHAFVDTSLWLRYWEQLKDTAPRLRFLDVHCHTWNRTPQAGWVGRFIESLRGYSLVCIRLILPQPPAPGADNAKWADEDVLALAELPDRLPQIMPSLRYVAWAAKRGTSEYEWFEDGYDCAYAEYKWYRVVEDNGARKPVTVSAGEGERVRRYLLNSSLETITNIDAIALMETIGGPITLEY